MSTDNVGSKTALIGQISLMLEEAGHKEPLAWVTRLHAMCPEIVDEEDVRVQRYMLNCFWANELGNHDVAHGTDTTNARFSLVEQGTLLDWVRLFKENVLPCIIKYNL